jgi:hypothetical protein
MIKEKSREETITRTVKTTTVHCDFCGVDVTKENITSRTCVICGRDICKEHIGQMNYEGDYIKITCTHCWEIGKEYRDKIEQLEEEIEKTQEEWYAKCQE